MSQYKVPQDVEAEDKILGPLTFKQFIYALVGVGWAGICFLLLHKIIPVMIVLAAPVTIIALLLAFYRRDGQNFEQLLIAMVGYFSQSRKRVWRKELVVETFHVTATPVAEEQTQRDPVEVKSQLERLGTLIDSRGWNDTTPARSLTSNINLPASDRLVDPAQTNPRTAPDEGQATDILDMQESPLAKNLAALIQEAAQDVRKEAIEQMKAGSGPVAMPATSVPAVPAPGMTASPQPVPGPTVPETAPANDIPSSQPTTIPAPAPLPAVAQVQQPVAPVPVQAVAPLPMAPVVAAPVIDTQEYHSGPLAPPTSAALPTVTHFGPPPPKPIPTVISTSVTSVTPGDILNLATQRDDLTVAQLAATATRLAPLSEGQTVDLRNNG